MRPFIALCFLLAAAACEAPASPSSSQEVHDSARLSVHDAWASPTPSGVDVSAGYLTIANTTNAPDHLLSATSARAARVEVHEMSMDGAVMRMRALDRLTIDAHSEAQLGPGGLHLMFFGVQEPFTEGQSIPVQLVFERAGAIDVSLAVRRTAPASHGDH